MRKGGGGDKGAGFERDTCRFLSRWVTSGERDDVFWRSASSGGRATTLAMNGKFAEYHSSDIAPMHPLAFQLLEIFTVECKFYADLHLQDLPFDRRSNIAVFWEQAYRDAKRVSKRPMLIARQNRKPTLLGLNTATYHTLYRAVRMPHSIVSERHDLVLMDKLEFFKLLNPQQLLEPLRAETPAPQPPGKDADHHGPAPHRQAPRRVPLGPLSLD